MLSCGTELTTNYKSKCSEITFESDYVSNKGTKDQVVEET
jgi:hypothetical protein